MIKVGEDLKMAVVVYSAGRADTLLTTKWLTSPDCYLCVPEAEANEYERKSELTLLVHPDDVVGLNAKARWVFDYFRGKADCVVKVDDDFSLFIDKYTYFLHDRDVNKYWKLDSDSFLQCVANLFLMCWDLEDCKVFGFSHASQPSFYDPWLRFSFKRAFDDSIIGYIYEEKMAIDPTLRFCFFYDLQIQGLHYYGKNLIDDRYRQWQFNMGKQKGGTSTYRTREGHAEALRMINQKWGGDVLGVKTAIGMWGEKRQGVSFRF